MRLISQRCKPRSYKVTHRYARLTLARWIFFILLRATTYVGWNITRMNEDGAAAGRNARFIETTKRLATAYLKV